MAETKEDKKVTENPPDCKACGDTRRVNLRMLGHDGEIFRDVPCPECGPGVRLADPGQIVTREDLDKLLALVIIAVALGAIAVLLSAKSGHRVSPFEEAIKEVKEAVNE